MRDARDLHNDLKKTAALELLHQQQVDADGQSSNGDASDSGLGASFSTAVSRLQLGRKNSKGKTSFVKHMLMRTTTQVPTTDLLILLFCCTACINSSRAVHTHLALVLERVRYYYC